MPAVNLYSDPVLAILALASVASWVIIVERIIALHLSKQADKNLSPSSPLAVFKSEIEQHKSSGREYIITILDTTIRARKHRLEGPLPVLGVIGSVAPYVGLLGTVIGIINAFNAIKAANNMSPSVVSGGIASALVATAAGLAVAIPAVAAHHLLMAAIARRVASWESTVAAWLPDEGK